MLSCDLLPLSKWGKSLLETEVYQQPLANFAWDLFRAIDLPDLAGQCAPRPIHLGGAVDGANHPIGISELQRIYSSANVRVSAAPAWDDTVLGSV